MLPANKDISACAISLADRPQRAIRVTSARMRREDRSSISFSSSRRPRRVRGVGYIIACSSSHAVVPVGDGAVLDDQAGWAGASSIFLASKFRPCARTLQAMRASLLASAMASTLRCSRRGHARPEGLLPARSGCRSEELELRHAAHATRQRAAGARPCRDLQIEHDVFLLRLMERK